MTPVAVKKTTKRNGNPKWVKGVSGNPNGRTRTSKSLAETIRKVLFEKDQDAKKKQSNLVSIIHKAVEQAKAGDSEARNFLSNRGFGKVADVMAFDAGTAVSIYLPDNGRKDMNKGQEPQER